MADKKEEQLEKGEYVIGVAIILAALLVSATVWISAEGLQKAVSGIQLVIPAATVQQAAPSGTGNAQGAGNSGQQVQAAAPTGDWSFEATDPSVGPANAPVTVTEFADFQCPYCGIAYGKDTGGSQFDSLRGTATNITNLYAKTGKIRFVYHIMAFLGQESTDAANAALCVRSVGGDTGFFAMHDKLFDEQGQEDSGVFSKANLVQYAAQIGYNSSTVANCINSGSYDTQVSQSNSEAGGVGVTGTPTFSVNNQIAPDPEYAALKTQIDSLLAK